jgi:hypothetical protein
MNFLTPDAWRARCAQVDVAASRRERAPWVKVPVNASALPNARLHVPADLVVGWAAEPAVAQAHGHEEAERREAWRRVELLERRIRQETRSALRNICGSLDECACERLVLIAAAECYPELAQLLTQVARAADGSALTNAQGDAQAKFLVWHEQAIAVTRRTIDELDATSERAGFLWIRPSDASLQDLIELARARLDSLVQGRPQHNTR